MTTKHAYFIINLSGGKTLKNILTTNSNFDLSSKSTFSSDDLVFTSSSIAALCASNKVPQAHKDIACNYRIIKQVFKFQACVGKISNVEKSLLERYDFSPLEYTTGKQMFEELTLLQQWTLSNDENLKATANEIFRIRIKELKYLEACSYVIVSNEIYNGYKSLEQYLKEISKV